MASGISQRSAPPFWSWPSSVAPYSRARWAASPTPRTFKSLSSFHCSVISLCFISRGVVTNLQSRLASALRRRQRRFNWEVSNASQALSRARLERRSGRHRRIRPLPSRRLAGNPAISPRRWNQRHGNLPHRESPLHDYRRDGKFYIRSEAGRRPQKRNRPKMGNTDGKFSAAVALGKVRRKMVPHVARFFAKGFLTPRHNFLALLAKPVNSQPHHISRPQIHRRLLPEPHAWRRARRNNVAGLQTHEPAQIAHQMSYAENHRLRRPVLVALSIHFQPQTQILRVRHFVSRHQPRPDRTKCIGAFPLHPLPRAFQLKRALRLIVHHAIARDVRKCL